MEKFSWNYIKGDTYFKIVDILEDKNLSGLEESVELVSVIAEIPTDEIYNMTMEESGKLFCKLKFLNSFELIPNYNPKYIKLPSFKIKIMKDVTNMTVSQYIDYQQFVLLPLREGYDKLLSIFLIPDGCKYNDGYDIIELQKEIREGLSWREVQTLLNFFMKRYLESVLHTLKSFNQAMLKEKNPERQIQMKTNRDKLIEEITAISTLGYV